MEFSLVKVVRVSSKELCKTIKHSLVIEMGTVKLVEETARSVPAAGSPNVFSWA
jgi:hypothetical protein